jgi:hypothetical protein
MIKGKAKNRPTTGKTILATTTKNKTNGMRIKPSVLSVVFSAAHFNLSISISFSTLSPRAILIHCVMAPQIVLNLIIPSKAEIQNYLIFPDAGLRLNDDAY